MGARLVQVLLLALVAALAGGAAAAQQTHDVDVQDNRFVPAEIEVEAGDTVVWTHSGRAPHTVTADDESFDSHPSYPSDHMEEGDTFSHTFDSPGEFAYYCRPHGRPGGVGMAGVIVVTEASEVQLAETGGVATLALLAAGLVALGLVIRRRFG